MPIVSNQTESGLSLYARFDDASNTAVDLTEGSSLDVGQYVASDNAIDTAGLAAGTYTVRIFIGTAATQANTDYFVGEVPEFKWDGTNEVLTSANSATAAVQAAAANTAAAAAKTRVEAALTASGDLNGKVLGAGAGVITAVGVRAHNADGDTIASTTDVGEVGTAVAVNNAAIAALPTPLTAAETRDALGLASANLDTQIAALPAQNATTLLGTTLTDAGAGKLGRSLYYLSNAFASNGVFSEPALAEAPSGGGATPDTRDLEPPQWIWRLSRRSGDGIESPLPLRIAPGESIRAGFDCKTAFVLPTGAVVASFTDPVGLTDPLTATKTGTNGQYCTMTITADADAAIGTEQTVSIEMMNSLDDGPVTLTARVIVSE